MRRGSIVGQNSLKCRRFGWFLGHFPADAAQQADPAVAPRGSALSYCDRIKGRPGMVRRASQPLHKTVDHLLLAGFFEGDGELVAIDLHDIAVAEFLV